MLSTLRTRVFCAVLILATGGALPSPAHAGVPVFDATNLKEAIQQVLSWGQQLRGMTAQYEAITGSRGMQNLMPITSAQRNYLPTNDTELQSVMNGTSTNYAALGAQVQSTVQSNAVLTPAQVSTLSPQAQTYLKQSRQTAATLAMLSHQTQSTTSTNFSALQRLITALGTTQDTKASADLAARIHGEQVMTQTNHIKTDALYQSVQAQQLQNAQTARENAVQSLGRMSSQPRISW